MRQVPRLTRALRTFTDLERNLDLKKPNDLDAKRQEVAAKVKK